MTKRYFEITVHENGFTSSRRWTDEQLRLIKIPLGELLEAEIEWLRKECVVASRESE